MKGLPKNPLDFVMALIPHDPERVLRKLLPKMAMAEVAPVAQPSVAQLKALRAIAPYTEVGLGEIKRQLGAGAVRFGPQHRAMLRLWYWPKLTSAGLKMTIRRATHEELKKAKLVDDEVPEYFRDRPGDAKK